MPANSDRSMIKGAPNLAKGVLAKSLGGRQSQRSFRSTASTPGPRECHQLAEGGVRQIRAGKCHSDARFKHMKRVNEMEFVPDFADVGGGFNQGHESSATASQSSCRSGGECGEEHGVGAVPMGPQLRVRSVSQLIDPGQQRVDIELRRPAAPHGVGHHCRRLAQMG